MAQRGSYAKGVAKREEILTTALEVIARNGWSGTTVKELSEAVGLSQAGLLHYFGSKEALFREVLRRRDEQDISDYGLEEHGSPLDDGLVRLVRHNAEVPGLVQLFARFSVEAAEPGHPAHDFFEERYVTARERIVEYVRALQSEGRIAPGLDAEKLAVMMLALADGLQVQWMYEPELDMAEHVAYLWELVRSAGPAPD